MAQEPWGIAIVEDEGAVGVYASETGIELFEVETPYLMTDDVSLQAPIEVRVVDGPVYLDAMGNACDAIPVVLPEDEV